MTEPLTTGDIEGDEDEPVTPIQEGDKTRDTDDDELDDVGVGTEG